MSLLDGIVSFLLVRIWSWIVICLDLCSSRLSGLQMLTINYGKTNKPCKINYSTKKYIYVLAWTQGMSAKHCQYFYAGNVAPQSPSICSRNIHYKTFCYKIDSDQLWSCHGIRFLHWQKLLAHMRVEIFKCVTNFRLSQWFVINWPKN